jgi:hypothetical protein
MVDIGDENDPGRTAHLETAKIGNPNSPSMHLLVACFEKIDPDMFTEVSFHALQIEIVGALNMTTAARTRSIADDENLRAQAVVGFAIAE